MAAGLAEIRARIKASLATVTGGGLTLDAANIVLGRVVLPEAGTFLSGMSATNPKLYIKPGSGSHDGKTGRFSIEMGLYFSITRTAVYTFENAENLIAAMVTALSGDDLRWDAPEVFEQDPAVVKYTLVVDALGC